MSSQCVRRNFPLCYFVNHRARISSSDLDCADCAIDGVVSVLPPCGSHFDFRQLFWSPIEKAIKRRTSNDRSLILADIWSAINCEWTKSGRPPPPLKARQTLISGEGEDKQVAAECVKCFRSLRIRKTLQGWNILEKISCEMSAENLSSCEQRRRRRRRSQMIFNIAYTKRSAYIV